MFFTVGRETHPHHLIADYTEVDTYRFGFDAIRSSGSVFTKEIIDEKTVRMTIMRIVAN